MTPPPPSAQRLQLDHSSPHLGALASALSVFHRTETNDLPAVLLLACAVEGFANLVGEAVYGKLWLDELEKISPWGKVRLLMNDRANWRARIWLDVKDVIRIRNDLAHPKPKKKPAAKARRRERAHEDAPRLLASVFEALRQLSELHTSTAQWPAIHQQLVEAKAKRSLRE